jgi:hypothetical protein
LPRGKQRSGRWIRHRGRDRSGDGGAAAEGAAKEEWMLDCTVDLTVPRPEEEPLLELVRIGT